MARKKNSKQLTRLELELMKVLWERGPSTVHQVQQALAVRRELAYTTIQTMLNLLHRKNKVRRITKARAFVYAPAVSRSAETKATMRDIIDRMFGGSAEELVMSLVKTDQLSVEELTRLRKSIEEPS